MRRLTLTGALGLGAVAGVLAAAGAARGQLLPLRVDSSQRFLERSDGVPFFWLGDTAWQLYRLDPGEVDQYMANRAAKGFNIIQGPQLLVGPGTVNHAGATNQDPAAPDAAWFEHIDVIVDAAEAHGLYIAPVLAWGTHAEQLAPAAAHAYGQFVGSRYRDRPHVAVYVIAGEFNHPASNTAVWTAVADGVLAGLDGEPRLLTAHPKWYGELDGQSTSGDLHDAPWLSFNLVQSSLYGDCTNDPEHFRYFGTHNWLIIENDHAMLPAKPTFDGEATYEQIPATPPPGCDPGQPRRWDAFGVRRRAYWSVFAGGFGHTYGANGVFQFHQSDAPNNVWAPLDYWDVAMEYPGASQMQHLKRLLESRPFFTRVPGQDLLAGDPGPDVPTHVHATRGADGRYAFVYVPEAGRTVPVDMSVMAGPLVNAWWYDPADGQATFIGAFGPGDLAPDGTLEFTTGAAGEDWVLVLDDAAQGFGPPGVPIEYTLPADVTGDGVVDGSDVVTLLLAWGPNPGHAADVDGDGVVGGADLVIMLLSWSGGTA